MLAGRLYGNTPDARNVAAKPRYWKSSKFGDWSLLSFHDWDLIELRREVLDEDGALSGPNAECGPQTVIHRLDALSKLLQAWARANKVSLDNPVKPGVRLSKPQGRDRRLIEGEEELLLAIAVKSSRPWLKAAIILSIETCMRQGELAAHIWSRVRLSSEYPSVDLPRTKIDKPRRAPLSVRAIVAIELLRPEGTAKKSVRGMSFPSRPVGGSFTRLGMW